MEILVLDDHPLVCCGIKEILREATPTDSIYGATTSAEALRFIVTHKIEIMIVDLYLENEKSFDFIRKVGEISKMTKCIVLTSSKRKEDLTEAVSYGVSGYILKGAYVEDIIYAVSVVKRGEKYYSSMLYDLISEASQDDFIKGLTEREKDVFYLVRKGYSNTRIADELCITMGTTKKHIGNILSKLGLQNRVDIIFYHNQEIQQKNCL